MSVKLLIVGDGGVGKTSYVKKLKWGNFNPNYVPTLGVDNWQIQYKNKTINIWDTTGQEKFCGLKEGYYIGSDCVIIMLDDRKLTLKSLSLYRKKIKEYSGDIPFIVLFNKSDIPETIKNYNLLKNYSNIENVTMCSSKNNLNIYEPIDRLLNLL
jgi:GTP-binding nuclear protein Ran